MRIPQTVLVFLVAREVKSKDTLSLKSYPFIDNWAVKDQTICSKHGNNLVSVVAYYETERFIFPEAFISTGLEL